MKRLDPECDRIPQCKFDTQVVNGRLVVHLVGPEKPMSKTFINGMLAEKAKLANQLICELLAEMPDELTFAHQDKLNPACHSLHEIMNNLRRQDDK